MITVTEFVDKKGAHRIRVKAANGKIIYSSTQGYSRKIDAKTAAISAAEAILNEYVSTEEGG